MNADAILLDVFGPQATFNSLTVERYRPRSNRTSKPVVYIARVGREKRVIKDEDTFRLLTHAAYLAHP